MSEENKIRIGHVIDVLSNSNTWFKVLIKNLKSENIILPYVTEGEVNFEKSNIKLVHIIRLKLPKNKVFFKISNKINSHFRYYLLKKQIVNNNIQVLHAHFAHVGWESIRLKKLLNIPLVVSFYGYDYQSVPYKYPIWVNRYEELFRHADIIICEGNNGPKILKKMGCNSSKIRVSRLGIELNKIAFIERIKKTESLNLVQIANLVEKKGHKYTLMAFAQALKNCPKMHLTIIGDGEERLKNEIMEIVEKDNLSDNVTIIKRIDYSKLHTILGDFDVFIHPSCHSKDMDCEGGAPIVLLDAQATGLPIISTFHCDIPDEVSHNKSGLLTEEKNTEELASFIERFYNMPQNEYDEFSINARKQVEQNYDIIKNVDRFNSIYREVLFNSM